MDEGREHKQTQDDLDDESIEIADLDADTHTRSKPAVVISLKPRFSSRQRLLQLIITTGTVILVLLIVLGSSISVRNLAARVLTAPTPVPTATLAPGVDLFYIFRQPPWGQVYLDGHLLSHLPVVGIDAPLRLSRGRHHLQWKADPFPLQSCNVSVPPLFTNSCNSSDTVQLKSGLRAWAITLSESADMLSANLRSSLIQAARTALDSQQSIETVLPGELYNHSSQNGGFATAAIARQPLRARFHFQLDTDPMSNTPCLLNGSGQGCFLLEQGCYIFCPNPAAESFAREWDVLVKLLPGWDYTLLNGHLLAQNQPDASGGAEGDEYLVPLSIFWDSGSRDWQVTALFNSVNAQEFVDPTCGSAEDEVQIDPSLKDVAINNSYVSWHFASGSIYAEGCVAIATPVPDNISTPTPSPRLAAICLHRFGLFLAANDLARQLWPYMPRADAYEQRLAQHLTAFSGVTVG